MMIKTENLTINGRELIRTYSDEGFMIERDGVRYSEAIDPPEFGRQYIETDEKIEHELEPEIDEKDEFARPEPEIEPEIDEKDEFARPEPEIDEKDEFARPEPEIEEAI